MRTMGLDEETIFLPVPEKKKAQRVATAINLMARNMVSRLITTQTETEATHSA